MTGWGHMIRYTVMAVGASALVAGYNHGGGTPSAGSPQASATPSIAPEAPTAFNGCQLPQSVIDAEHLDPNPLRADSADLHGDVWRGCAYSTYEGDGYGTSIRTTNLTVPMLEGISDYTIAEHLTIDGRQAITYREATEKDLRANCIINVEMKGGGLEILVTNPDSHKATGTLDSCDIAKKLAGDLVPTFPASA
jgi:hypothetical protein